MEVKTYHSMDFVTHLPRTSRKHDVVWVIVDRLTNSAHFLAVRMIGRFVLCKTCTLSNIMISEYRSHRELCYQVSTQI